MRKTVSIRKVSSPPTADQWTLGAILLAMLGLAQFAQGILAAVDVFPGSYRWQTQFLSELGMTRTWFGRDNLDGSALFTRSMVCLGVSLIPFFLNMFRTETDYPQSTLTTAWCGCISACGLIGLGLTPIDKLIVTHHIFLAIWLLPLLVAACLRLHTAQDSLLSLLLTLVLAITIVWLGLSMGIDAAPKIQKIVILLSAIWLLDVARQLVTSGTLYIREVFYDEPAVDRYVQKLERRGLVRPAAVHPNELAKDRPRRFKPGRGGATP